ncbi:glycosyltransferase family 2 protein [Chitinibacter fontanus]|uniref:Glycosyltransferase family 2 protein n=1 Tax=Chitinibacter fontanus TaxID=1737446 RepID=A0A7D5ZDI9_9NEIS|nr:glycosyltransferase family A protein [Chitinibacter fontanus]QLI80508.1 glycosyltransferase family 2 protein [Chitinibacter fontanus]
MTDFVFVVITYNHQSYIIEHLESIKYQVEKYANGRLIKLIVSDDGSKDKTIQLVKFWLASNSQLFSEVIVKSDGVNRGTCLNYTSTWEFIDSEFFKITAGDDVYSKTNIFEFAEGVSGVDILSGAPLLLIDGVVVNDFSLNFHLFAGARIYRNNFLARLEGLSVINTPSLFFNRKIIQIDGLVDFINQYKVVEDFPMQIKIGEAIPEVQFVQSTDVVVYYRRTSGSAYIVKNDLFSRDKKSLYEYLLSRKTGCLGRLLLRNRLFCFGVQNKLFRLVLNLNLIPYLLRLIPCFVHASQKAAGVSIGTHQEHYMLLKRRSDAVIELYENSLR